MCKVHSIPKFIAINMNETGADKTKIRKAMRESCACYSCCKSFEEIYKKFPKDSNSSMDQSRDGRRFNFFIVDLKYCNMNDYKIILTAMEDSSAAFTICENVDSLVNVIKGQTTSNASSIVLSSGIHFQTTLPFVEAIEHPIHSTISNSMPQCPMELENRERGFVLPTAPVLPSSEQVNNREDDNSRAAVVTDERHSLIGSAIPLVDTIEDQEIRTETEQADQNSINVVGFRDLNESRSNLHLTSTHHTVAANASLVPESSDIAFSASQEPSLIQATPEIPVSQGAHAGVTEHGNRGNCSQDSGETAVIPLLHSGIQVSPNTITDRSGSLKRSATQGLSEPTVTAEESQIATKKVCNVAEVPRSNGTFGFQSIKNFFSGASASRAISRNGVSEPRNSTAPPPPATMSQPSDTNVQQSSTETQDQLVHSLPAANAFHQLTNLQLANPNIDQTQVQQHFQYILNMMNSMQPGHLINHTQVESLPPLMPLAANAFQLQTMGSNQQAEKSQQCSRTANRMRFKESNPILQALASDAPPPQPQVLQQEATNPTKNKPQERPRSIEVIEDPAHMDQLLHLNQPQNLNPAGPNDKEVRTTIRAGMQMPSAFHAIQPTSVFLPAAPAPQANQPRLTNLNDQATAEQSATLRTEAESNSATRAIPPNALLSTHHLHSTAEFFPLIAPPPTTYQRLLSQERERNEPELDPLRNVIPATVQSTGSQLSEVIVSNAPNQSETAALINEANLRRNNDGQQNTTVICDDQNPNRMINQLQTSMNNMLNVMALDQALSQIPLQVHPLFLMNQPGVPTQAVPNDPGVRGMMPAELHPMQRRPDYPPIASAASAPHLKPNKQMTREEWTRQQAEENQQFQERMQMNNKGSHSFLNNPHLIALPPIHNPETAQNPQSIVPSETNVLPDNHRGQSFLLDRTRGITKPNNEATVNKKKRVQQQINSTGAVLGQNQFNNQQQAIVLNRNPYQQAQTQKEPRVPSNFPSIPIAPPKNLLGGLPRPTNRHPLPSHMNQITAQHGKHRNFEGMQVRDESERRKQNDGQQSSSNHVESSVSRNVQDNQGELESGDRIVDHNGPVDQTCNYDRTNAEQNNLGTTSNQQSVTETEEDLTEIQLIEKEKLMSREKRERDARKYQPETLMTPRILPSFDQKQRLINFQHGSCNDQERSRSHQMQCSAEEQRQSMGFVDNENDSATKKKGRGRPKKTTVSKSGSMGSTGIQRNELQFDGLRASSNNEGTNFSNTYGTQNHNLELWYQQRSQNNKTKPLDDSTSSGNDHHITNATEHSPEL